MLSHAEAMSLLELIIKGMLKMITLNPHSVTPCFYVVFCMLYFKIVLRINSCTGAYLHIA